MADLSSVAVDHSPSRPGTDQFQCLARLYSLALRRRRSDGVSRRTARRTAVVVHSADETAASSANATAPAQSQAAAPAAPAPSTSAPGALRLGTVVNSLHGDCIAEAVGGV